MYNIGLDTPFEDFSQGYTNAYVPGDWGLPKEPYPEPQMPHRRLPRLW